MYHWEVYQLICSSLRSLSQIVHVGTAAMEFLKKWPNWRTLMPHLVLWQALVGDKECSSLQLRGFAKTTGNQLPLAAAARAVWRLEKRRQTCKWQLGRWRAWRSRDPWEAPSCHAPMWGHTDCWGKTLQFPFYWNLMTLLVSTALRLTSLFIWLHVKLSNCSMLLVKTKKYSFFQYICKT